MLNHYGFQFVLSADIDAVFVHIQLPIDFDDAVVVLDVGCKFVVKEGLSLEENRFVECAVTQNHIQFAVGQGVFQNVFVDDPDGFPCFFHAVIVSL